MLFIGAEGAYLEDESADDQQKPNVDQNGNQTGRKYFRVLRSIDVSTGENSKTVQGVLENVFPWEPYRHDDNCI